MIVYFLLIILASTVSGDDNDSDTEYIKTLPASVKKGLLDKVARRILNEVPEVNSGADDINGDVLAEKLEAQSEFVKKILKQEVESLKTKRRYFQKLKRFRKSGNDNHQLSGMADSENLHNNDTLFIDTDAKITASDKIDADVGHIDLTLRSGRSKRGDSGNDNDNTTEHGTTENKHENHDGEFVPVAIKLDSENENSEPIKDSNSNVAEVLKVEEASDDDIQIRHTKQSDDKKIEIVKEIPEVITDNAENINETTTQSGLDIKTTFKNEGTSIKIHFGRKSEDLNLNETQGLANIATVEVSTIPNSLNTSLNDTKSLEDTTMPNVFNTTVADVKVSSSETDDDEKHKTDRIYKYSSESYLDNPVIDSKARKNLNVLDSKETYTLKREEAPVKNEPHLNNTSVHVTDEPLKHFSGITTLITTETPYVATTTENQPSINISTEIDSNALADHQKKPKNLETTEKNSKDSILIVSEITTATNADNASTNVEVINSSKVVDAKYIKTSDKKPCNETSSKLGVITDCDKKRNKAENTTTEINNVNETQKIDNEPKVKATVNAEVKYNLRTVKKKPVYDSLLHFGDMQIKKEYEVHEVDSGEPAFVSQNEKDNNERSGIEQPRYAPVYNYDPKNAYFNAYNRLGPNENDKDDDSESSKPGNENILRTKNIRMSKYIKEHKRKKDDTDTTKPYFSKEANCEDSESIENKEKKSEVFVLPDSHEVGFYPYTNKKNYLSHVRQNYFKNQEFGYVPTQKEKDKKFSSVAKYLYNNDVGSRTEEILSEGAGKKYLRINDDNKYIVRDDASEINSNTGEETKDKKQIEVVVLDMNENKSTVLRQGYYSSRYKWDEEGNFFTEKGKVYDLAHIVPYFTEKSIILKQRQQSNKIYDMIHELWIQNKSNDIQYQMISPKRLDKILDYFKSLDTSKTLFNKTSVNAMMDRIEKYANIKPSDIEFNVRPPTTPTTTTHFDHFIPFTTEKIIIKNQIQESNKPYDRIKKLNTQSDNEPRRLLKMHPKTLNKTSDFFKSLDMNKTLSNKTSVNDVMNRLEKYANIAPSDTILYPDTPSIPSSPRHFQYLKERLINLRHQTTETQNDSKQILRTSSCNKPKKCLRAIKANNTSKFKTPNDKLNSINKITQITPEVDMLQNVESMLKINGFPIARSREDDLDLYVRILKDMVKMDNGALEEYDWLGTTVSVQSAIAKLRSIIDQKKSSQRIHPYDTQLFKYVEELYTKASEVTKEKEGETLDEHIEDSKEDRKVSNNERMALPKTHRKIKNPWKVLMQISDLMYKKVLRNKVAQRTKKFELFLDCLQQCLDDFHTAIKELTKITKYNNQRWYKNIKELYLAAGTDKEYLEVLLHLYSARLFTLIEESAKNGAEVDYRMYMKENRIEVDRAEVEMMFIIRILKTIHDIRMD